MMTAEQIASPLTPGESRIRGLGYLGLTAPDLDAWRTFATEICGLQISRTSTRDELLLRSDERAWRVSVVPGEGQLAYVGWEVAGRADLDRLAAELDAAGIPVDTPDIADDRQVTGLIRVKDPAGNQVEFFYGAKVDEDRFVSPRGVTFRTGDQGLGHIVLGVPDMAEAMRFYLDTLGFRISDRIRLGDHEALFTHVNPRHHSLALAPSPTGPTLRHFMLETADLDSVGYALDRVMAGGAELRASLGKHTNDHMVSFYMKSPSACEVEYGWNGRAVDDAIWTTARYDKASLWGHRRVVPVSSS